MDASWVKGPVWFRLLVGFLSVGDGRKDAGEFQRLCLEVDRFVWMILLMVQKL